MTDFIPVRDGLNPILLALVFETARQLGRLWPQDGAAYTEHPAAAPGGSVSVWLGPEPCDRIELWLESAVQVRAWYGGSAELIEEYSGLFELADPAIADQLADFYRGRLGL